MKSTFDFSSIGNIIEENTQRIMSDEKAHRSRSGSSTSVDTTPPFVATAQMEKRLEESNRRTKEAAQALLDIDTQVMATRSHQDNHLNISKINASIMPQGYNANQGGYTQNYNIYPTNNQGVMGENGQMRPKTPEEILAEEKRKASMPKKLLPRSVMKTLAENVKTRVFGQDHVVDELTSILKIASLGIQINKEKPAGCYFLAGPSGCGKTEMVLSFKEFLGEEGRPIPFLKLNMGEFGMENDVTKLIGPPPGYRGNETGGQLTNFVLENPISIILFDEMEKAHESMDKIFLSILDKGVCSDGKGRQVFFKDTIIFVTSNLGAEAEYNQHMTAEEKHKYRMEAIFSNLRPEIVNRFDTIAQCNALPLDIYKMVMGKFLKELYKNMHEVHGITLSHTDELLNWAAKVSYDPSMGGRPARKFIEKVMVQPLADAMINEEIDTETVKNLVMDLDEGKVCFREVLENGKYGPALGRLENTDEIVAMLEAGKFKRDGKSKSADLFSEEAIARAMSAMEAEQDAMTDPDIVNVMPKTKVKSNVTPSPKVNRKSSRNDFSPG